MANNFDASTGYRIKSVAGYTGLSPHTIRKWEERYQLLSPIRSENGYRLYQEDDIQFLTYLKCQIESGKTIGKLAKRGFTLLRREMKEGPIQVVGIAQPFSEIAMLLIQAARQLNQSLTEELIQKVVKNLGVERAFWLVFFPVLFSVGELWHRGRISLNGERIVTQAIRRHLADALQNSRAQKGPTVIIACAPKDFHEIGAMTATLHLQHNGWHPIYLGANSDIDMIRVACKRRIAQRIIISMVREPNQHEIFTILKQIRSKLLPLCPVIIGGHGASGFKDLLNEPGICLFHDLSQIKELKPYLGQMNNLNNATKKENLL